MPLSLICDNIRDPGNLGTILRCAAAAGCHDVLLTKGRPSLLINSTNILYVKTTVSLLTVCHSPFTPQTGCVDAWEPKVLRAAMGAHFCLPIYPSLSWGDIEKHLPKPVTVHVADNRRRPDLTTDAAEAQVNEPHTPAKAADYGWVSTRRNKSNAHYEDYDSDSDSDSEDEGASPPRVDTKLYHESWAQIPTALVIGGETHGLSVEAVQLAEKTAGQRLFIPVVPEVDSLNSAMAASILLFEGRKQLLKAMETSGGKGKRKAERDIS